MMYADKNGHAVQVGTFVTIPFFPEYADKSYEITAIPENSDMYEITEVDEECNFVGNSPILVEPWKVESI